MAKNRNIDLGMAVVAAITPEGHRWSQRDLAEICGVTGNAISLIEQKALAKLRRAAARRETLTPNIQRHLPSPNRCPISPKSTRTSAIGKPPSAASRKCAAP